MKMLITVLCAFFLNSADAAVYKWVDAAGNIYFSDQPQEGAVEVELREPTVFQGMRPEKSTGQDQPVEKPAVKAIESEGYRRFAITSPENDVTIWTGGPGDVEVDVDLEPNLKEGHQMVLKLDGIPLSRKFIAGRVVIPNMDRGTHRLAAEIHDQAGGIVTQSEPVVFHLKRHSIK